jgi:hypothetical protein
MGLFKRRGGSPEERFAKDVLDVVRSAHGVSEASFDPEAFAIRYRRADGGDSGWLYLHNTYRETAGLGRREQAERIRRLVAAVVEPVNTELDWPEIRPLLRPVLRGVSFGQGAPQGAKSLLSRPALPYLVELVVVDRPTSMAYVLESHAEQWGVEPAEVFAIARENLAQGAANAARGEASDGPTVLRFLDDGDAYFTSMLLVDGFLASLAPRVGGRPVAFVPDKDNLSILADEPSALAKFLELFENEFNEATRSLSPMAYTVDTSGAVVPYVAEEPGELANRLHRARVVLAAGEYQAQKEALDARHQREGVDVFVGSLLAAGRPDGSVFSLAVWADDCDTLLPEADFVGFQSERDSLTVPWAVVAREVGLTPLAGLAPARYRVTQWPPEAIMTRLRADAITL